MQQLLHTMAESVAEAIIAAILLVTAALFAKGQGYAEAWFKKKSEPLESTHRDDVEIMLILERARLSLGAQRVYLSKYHNGDHFDDDSDIRRKSRTHEVVDEGVSYQADEFRGILTSTVPDETTLVMQPGPSFKRVDEIKHGKFRWLCERGGTKAVARAAIRKGHSVIGFVGADFWTTNEPDNIAVIVDAANDIDQLLSRRK